MKTQTTLIILAIPVAFIIAMNVVKFHPVVGDECNTGTEPIFLEYKNQWLCCVGDTEVPGSPGVYVDCNYYP